MIRKAWWLIFIFSLFLFTACTAKAPTTAGGGAFIGGTSGVVAAFEPLSIKEGDIYSIFDTEDFSLDISVKNKGEETVPQGKVTLRLLGPAQSLFQNIPLWQKQNAQPIDKISEFNPTGGEEIVSFTPTGGARYTAPVTGVTDITWNLEYWYDYKTHLIVNDVCYKGDITDPKVCEVKGPKIYSVSSAPITVDAVEQETAGRGIILLKIMVRDAGTGQSTIPGQEFDNRFDQIRYSIDESTQWKCTSGGRENQAQLVDGKAEIICRLRTPLAENDLYTKQSRLTLDYTYKELIQEKLRIKESAR